MSIPLTEKVLHDPDAILPYQMDWTDWLVEEGNDALESATVVIDPPDQLVVQEGSIALVGGAVRWWMSGGVPNTVYAITVHIVTLLGREDDRTTRVSVKER